MRKSAVLFLALAVSVSACDEEPVPEVVTYTRGGAGYQAGNTVPLLGRVDPRETFVSDIEVIAGKRPGLETPVFMQGAILLDEDEAGPGGTETIDEFEFRGSVPSSSELGEGGVVDYEVWVTYRRPGETQTRTFVTPRRRAVIGPPAGSYIELEVGSTELGPLQSTNLIVRLIGDHALTYDVKFRVGPGPNPTSATGLSGLFEIRNDEGELLNTLTFGPEEHFVELTLAVLEPVGQWDEAHLEAYSDGWGVSEAVVLTIVN